jgi:hypothetical protein
MRMKRRASGPSCTTVQEDSTTPTAPPVAKRVLPPWQPCSMQSSYSGHTPTARTRGSALHRTTSWRHNPDRPGTHSPAFAQANSSCDASTPGAPPIPLLPNQSPSPQPATTTRVSWIFLVFPHLPPSQLLAIPYSQHRTDCSAGQTQKGRTYYFSFSSPFSSCSTNYQRCNGPCTNGHCCTCRKTLTLGNQALVFVGPGTKSGQCARLQPGAQRIR